MRPTVALVPAGIPVLALVFALPLVNRLEPVILGLPFLLFWILAWVLATPVFLGLAYAIDRRARGGPDAWAGSAADTTGREDRSRP